MNADAKLASFRDRLIVQEREKRDIVESIKDIYSEMKAAFLTKEEIAGVKLRVKREWEDPMKAAFRSKAEDVADSLALSGAPLFAAAS